MWLFQQSLAWWKCLPFGEKNRCPNILAHFLHFHLHSPPLTLPHLNTQMDRLSPSLAHIYTQPTAPYSLNNHCSWGYPSPHGVSEQQWFRTISLDLNTVNGRRNIWETPFPRSLEIWWRWNGKNVGRTDDKPRCLNPIAHRGARTHARTQRKWAGEPM